MAESSPEVAPRPIELDDAGRFAEHFNCLECDYSLYKQSPGGACPECGYLINDSLKSHGLKAMAKEWLEQIPDGAIFLAIASPLTVIFGLGLLFWFCGCMMFCGQFPAKALRTGRLHGIAMICCAAMIALFISTYVVITSGRGVFGNNNRDVVLVALAATMAATAIHLYSLHKLVATLCQHVRWKKLAVFSSAMAFIGPVLAVGFFGIPVADILQTGFPEIPLLEVLFALSLYGTLCYGLTIPVLWGILAFRLVRLRTGLQGAHKSSESTAPNPRNGV